MQSLNISIPDALKQYVDELVAKGSYKSASEYLRDLIRADERHRAQAQLEAMLLEGLEGPETAMTPEDWRAIRQEALAVIEVQNASR